MLSFFFVVVFGLSHRHTYCSPPSLLLKIMAFCLDQYELDKCPLLSLAYAPCSMHICVSLWLCNSVTNGLNDSMKSTYVCLVEEKFRRKKISNVLVFISRIIFDRYLEEKHVSCSYSHYYNYKAVILPVHTNTRVGCIKRNLCDSRHYALAIFSLSFYVYV